MSVYLCIFKDYPHQVKIGMSTNVKKRVQTQINEHGDLLLFEEYSGGDKLQDHVVERKAINIVRQRGKLSGVYDTKSGSTEFFNIGDLPDGLETFRTSIRESGYSITDKTMDIFKPRVGKGHGQYLGILRKHIMELRSIDSVILTGLLLETPLPDNLQDFHSMSKLLSGTANEEEWCTTAMLKVARELSVEFPEGIFQ